LRRGVEDLQHGLERLESDLAYRLPKVGGDLGAVASSINQMADARDALEQQLRQRERLAALGRVVGGVAHEIRNPLNSMRLTLELLARKVRKGQADASQIDAAVAEVDRLDEILTKLLAFGRPGFEARDSQPIRPIVERAVHMAEERADRRGIQIAFDPGGESGRQAQMDGSQIEQVLLNLLLNAVDASADGDRVEVAVRNGGGRLAVEVADFGSGIEPEARDKIFDPYFTTKDTGSGLGLAVSREIARRHGGDLSFERADGRTVFTLELPAWEGQEA
jgi:signal transduction histidine kinase